MPNSTSVFYKQSLIALTVLSVSACSSLPHESDVSPRASEEVSHRAGEPVPVAVKNIGQDLPTELNAKIRTGEPLTPSMMKTETTASTMSAKKPTKALIPRVGLELAQVKKAHEPEGSLYEVATGENLWRIAKKTTGDARNWHILAEVNNLLPNAAVFPGQKLVIPANLAIKKRKSAHKQADARASSQALEFKVDSGETLWKFTKRITGDATNWQIVASHNNFTQEQSASIHPGQSISVPRALIGPDYEGVSRAEPTVSQMTASPTGSTEDDTAVTAPSAGTALPEVAQELAETQNSTLVEVVDDQAQTAYVSLTDQSHAMALIRAHYRKDDNYDPAPTTQNPQAIEETPVSMR